MTVENRGGGVQLAGTLTLPRHSAMGELSAVLLITGSGPQDRDEMVLAHRPFLILADHLTRAGVAVLRLDDRGVGKSTGNFAQATGDDFASDVASAVAFLRARPEIDPKRVGLLGHSEGGVVAPMVAAKDRDIAFVVLIAAPGLPLEQLLIRQARDVLRLGGADEATLRGAGEFHREVFAIVRTVDPAEATRQIRAAYDRVTAKLKPAELQAMQLNEAAVQAQVKLLSSPWFRQILRYDPAATLKAVTCPVLAVCGEKDVQVAAGENLAAIAAALKSGGNRNAQTVELPGHNHLLQRCTTGGIDEYGTIEETMSPAALEQMSKWVLSVVALNKRS